MTKYLLLFGMTATLLVVTSCASLPHNPNETYILVATNTRIPYWQAASAGLTRAAAEMKVKAEMEGPERYDPTGERDAFRNAVGEKPAGILVSPADAKLLTPEIDSALQQGIPVITIDSDAPNSKRLLFVGTDNYTAGRLGGELLVKLLGGKGSVVIFSYPNQTNLIERQQGYESVFEDHPDIKVTQAVNIQGDPAVAYSTAKQLLDAKAKVDAFVCLEAVACPEAGTAVSESNMGGKITIMAMDTDQRTLTYIQQGVINATIAQRPYTMAYFGMKLLDELHHHPLASMGSNLGQNPFSPLPTFIDTGAFIVDKSSAAAFIQQNKEHGLQ
jgi:ribose transport system substrate-binding protein